jgi:hypothetical protein
MNPIRLLAAAAVTAFIAGQALAQAPAATPDAGNMPPMTQPAPAADQSGMPASAVTVDPVTGMTVVREPTSTPEQAASLTPGAANVVTNGPIPDTAENRARYGAPISKGGKRTPPAGN